MCVTAEEALARWLPWHSKVLVVARATFAEAATVEPSTRVLNDSAAHFALRCEVALPEGFEPSYQP